VHFVIDFGLLVIVAAVVVMHRLL